MTQNDPNEIEPYSLFAEIPDDERSGQMLGALLVVSFCAALVGSLITCIIWILFT